MKDASDPTWQYIKRAFGKTQLGIAKLDLSGNILDCNAYFALLSGRDVTATIGLNVSRDLTRRQDLEDSLARIAQLRAGESLCYQKRIVTISGIERLCQVNAHGVSETDVSMVDYIVDAAWELDESSGRLTSELDKLQAAFDMMRTLYEHQQSLLSQMGKGGVTVNTGNRYGDVGGDVVGRDKQTSDQSNFRALVIGFIAMAGILAWLFYYVAVTIGGRPVETPPAIVSPTE